MTGQDAKPGKSAKASKNVKRKAKTAKPEVGELEDTQLDQVQGGTMLSASGGNEQKGIGSGSGGGRVNVQDLTVTK